MASTSTFSHNAYGKPKQETEHIPIVTHIITDEDAGLIKVKKQLNVQNGTCHKLRLQLVPG